MHQSPHSLQVLTKYATLIPGCAETINTLRSEFGVKIGSTTGFIKEMVDVLLAEAKKQGYVPDASVAGDEVAHGARPKPFMVYKNMDLLVGEELRSTRSHSDLDCGRNVEWAIGTWICW